MIKTEFVSNTNSSRDHLDAEADTRYLSQSHGIPMVTWKLVATGGGGRNLLQNNE